jgi:hypothetical protein
MTEHTLRLQELGLARPRMHHVWAHNGMAFFDHRAMTTEEGEQWMATYGADGVIAELFRERTEK